MADFKEGNVVTIKSGGPKMTINQVRENGDVECIFFEGNEQKWITVSKETLQPWE